MLIIGHRGSSGTIPENTIESLTEAIRVGADILEFDVRLTKDKRPVLAHDRHILKAHHRLDYYRRHTLAELKQRTKNSRYPATTLEQALRVSYGRIVINIEIKESAAVEPILKVAKKYIKTKGDWDNILFSSSSPFILRKLRKAAPKANLSLVHYSNPLTFLVWYRSLDLTAVGFHRLYLPSFSLSVAKELGLFTYVYTVNRPQAAKKLLDKGVDGLVTDYPATMLKEV
ncbi:MAG TPA: glycerophosphodiester phosphodiesterase, partial [Candidatus Saccharimonadales bacterium]|nr:glycerophosphodiester phosphodiesterase [Candidatus Saccharimonadales bacterium]